VKLFCKIKYFVARNTRVKIGWHDALGFVTPSRCSLKIAALRYAFTHQY